MKVTTTDLVRIEAEEIENAPRVYCDLLRWCLDNEIVPASRAGGCDETSLVVYVEAIHAFRVLDWLEHNKPVAQRR